VELHLAFRRFEKELIELIVTSSPFEVNRQFCKLSKAIDDKAISLFPDSDLRQVFQIACLGGLTGGEEIPQAVFNEMFPTPKIIDTHDQQRRMWCDIFFFLMFLCGEATFWVTMVGVVVMTFSSTEEIKSKNEPLFLCIVIVLVVVFSLKYA